MSATQVGAARLEHLREVMLAFKLDLGGGAHLVLRQHTRAHGDESVAPLLQSRNVVADQVRAARQ